MKSLKLYALLWAASCLLGISTLPASPPAHINSQFLAAPFTQLSTQEWKAIACEMGCSEDALKAAVYTGKIKIQKTAPLEYCINFLEAIELGKVKYSGIPFVIILVDEI